MDAPACTPPVPAHMNIQRNSRGGFEPAQGLARGFTLLEILVAFTVMALVVAVLMRVFSGGLQGIGLAENYARATSVAEAKLALVGTEIPLQPGDLSGVDADKYQWRVVILPFEENKDPAQAQLGQPQAVMRVQLFQVGVQVAWSDFGKERHVALNTMLLGPKQ